MSDFVVIAKTITVLTFNLSEFQIPPDGVEAGLCGRILMVRRGVILNLNWYLTLTLVRYLSIYDRGLC